MVANNCVPTTLKKSSEAVFPMHVRPAFMLTVYLSQETPLASERFTSVGCGAFPDCKYFVLILYWPGCHLII